MTPRPSDLDPRPDQSPIKVIELFPIFIECRLCGEEDLDSWSMPVDENGDEVDNRYEEAWGGVPLCRACYHKKYGVK